MSHVVTIKTDREGRGGRACGVPALGLPQPVQGTHRLFTSSATGLAVQLPKWRYPVVCDLTTGQLQYDNFKGHWGDNRSTSMPSCKPTPSRRPRSKLAAKVTK